MINEELKNQLKLIIDKDFGLKLSDKEMLEMGSTLVDLFETLGRIESKTEYEYENHGDSIY